MIGTVAGGVIGYCVMLKSQAATNPYAIMTIACTIAFFGAFPATTQASFRSVPLKRPSTCAQPRRPSTSTRLWNACIMPLAAQ